MKTVKYDGSVSHGLIPKSSETYMKPTQFFAAKMFSLISARNGKLYGNIPHLLFG